MDPVLTGPAPHPPLGAPRLEALLRETLPISHLQCVSYRPPTREPSHWSLPRSLYFLSLGHFPFHTGGQSGAWRSAPPIGVTFLLQHLSRPPETGCNAATILLDSHLRVEQPVGTLSAEPSSFPHLVPRDPPVAIGAAGQGPVAGGSGLWTSWSLTVCAHLGPAWAWSRRTTSKLLCTELSSSWARMAGRAQVCAGAVDPKACSSGRQAARPRSTVPGACLVSPH